MERRTLLKTISGIAGAATVGGTGLAAMTGDAAASQIDISAGGGSLTNDDGDVKEVFIDPSLDVSWANLDDAVGAVSIFVEARVVGGPSGPNGGFFPLHRSQVELLPTSYDAMTQTAPSTTGSLSLNKFSQQTDNRVDGTKAWASGTSDDGDLRVADAEVGAPDYSNASEGYLQGANVYDQTIPDDQPLPNGEYGAAAGTTPFEVPGGGDSKTTTVELRYTVQLVELSLGQFTRITGYDPVAETDGTVGAIRDDLDRLHNATDEAWDANLNNAGFLSDVQPEDITVVSARTGGNGYTEDPSVELYGFETNQRLLAMGDLDGNEDYPALPFDTSRHNADVRAYYDDTDHPAVLTAGHDDTLSFDVTVTNQAESGVTGSGNSNGGLN